MGFYVNAGYRRPKRKQGKKGPSVGKRMEIEWVDRPSRQEPVWHVYADDHDGEGFKPAGTHVGDPREFQPW